MVKPSSISVLQVIVSGQSVANPHGNESPGPILVNTSVMETRLNGLTVIFLFRFPWDISADGEGSGLDKASTECEQVAEAEFGHA